MLFKTLEESYFFYTFEEPKHLRSPVFYDIREVVLSVTFEKLCF